MTTQELDRLVRGRVVRKAIALTGVALFALSGVASAQVASVGAKAEFRVPEVDEELKAYASIADWAAAGFQAGVSAESRGNAQDHEDSFGKSEAFFSQLPGGLSVAKGYAFSGSRHSTYPLTISARSTIFSQHTLRVTTDIFSPPAPFALKGYLPVHGTFGAFDFTHEVASATASATTGVRVQASGLGGPDYDVTHKGTVTVRSTDYDYSGDSPTFTVEATDDFKDMVTIRNDLPIPEGFTWTTQVAELSTFLVFDLPFGGGLFGVGGHQDYDISFLQEITATATQASNKYAFADLRNTTGFEIVAVDLTTGERLNDVINVQIMAAGASAELPAAAPEPASLAVFATTALPFAAVCIHRRRRSSLRK